MVAELANSFAMHLEFLRKGSRSLFGFRYDFGLESSILESMSRNEPLRGHDPFSDEEAPLPVAASSKESIRSFWVCTAGLAVLAHLAIYLELLAMRTLDDLLFNRLVTTPLYYRWIAESRYPLYIVFSQSFVPCLILGTVVPILYWRGGLAQRFVVSLAIVVAAMNSSVSSRGWQPNDHKPLLSLLAISSCWTIFPILFLFTPIRTERLRLIVATCMLVLTVCVSFINMADLRQGHEFLYWQTLFGSAFIYGILRRNWGNVAILESSATKEQVYRTSSATLLELMAVCGLATASYMYLSQSSYYQPVSYYLRAALLGVISILVFMSGLKRFQTLKLKHIPWLVLTWLVMFALIHSNTLMSISNNRNIFSTWLSLLDSPLGIFAAFFSGIASLLLLAYLWFIGFWLRMCGWRLAE